VESSGIPFQNVARMRPWMIANVLIVQAMAQQGFPVEQGLGNRRIHSETRCTYRPASIGN
jgi:uncharacterized protein YbaP (TraB family)